MAKQKPLYQRQDGERGHRAPGVDQATHRTLAERGLLKEPTKKRSTRRRPSKKSTAKKKAGGSDGELPSRSRRKVERHSRHFRFLLDVDDKLQDLTEHYDGTMTYVMSRLIHEEWTKMKRQERRAAKESAGHGGAEGAIEDD